MISLDELEKLVLDLPERERGILASRLLESMSPVLHDEDDGIAEALRRDAELESQSASGLSLEDLDHRIMHRRQSCA